MAGDQERLWRAFHPPPEHYDVRDTAAFAVTLAQRALRRHLSDGRWGLGTNEGQDLVLLEVARLGGEATARALEASLSVGDASLCRVLGRAEAIGYLRRRRDPRDGRIWRLELTSMGRAVAVRAAYLWRGADEALRERLSDSTVVWLRRLSEDARGVWLAPSPLRPPGGTV